MSCGQPATGFEGEAHPWLLHRLQEEANRRGGIVLACNAMPDHIHLFVTLPPTIAVATFIGQVKGAVSFAYNRQFGTMEPLSWQEGYGVVTVRKGEMARVTAYIENQQTIHANRKASRTLETTTAEPTP